MGKEHEGARVGGFSGPRLKTVQASAAHVLLVRTWSHCKGAWVIRSSCVFRKKRKMMLVNGWQSQLQRRRGETEPLNVRRFFFP